MARFSAVLFFATALLIMAGRLAHAAPSTAEVFWRAVLPRSAVPDAVYRLLRPGHSAVGARDDPSDLDSNKDSSKRLAAERAGQLMGNFLYHYGGTRNREVATAAGEAAASGYIYKSPFSYYYKEPSENHHAGGHAAASMAGGDGAATTTTATVFFHEEAVRVGERLPFFFPAAAHAAHGLLPRHVADSIPFTTAALPGVLALLGISPASAEAAGMAETLRTCELPPLAWEPVFCATSLEALVERAMAALGTRDVRAVTSALPHDGAPLQLYTVRAVRPVEGASFMACHDVAYPYTVYRCHGTGPARAYMVEMEGGRGGTVTLATVCHTDTSRWNPEHDSFKLLGTKPGGAPVCHLMPYGHMIWAKNVKVSPA